MSCTPWRRSATAGHRHVLGGFRTELSPPPYFVEERLVFEPAPAGRPDVGQVLAQLDALGVGFGACHTEYVVDEGGRARIIEVNYRAIGDQCDLLLAELLDIPLFEYILRTHLGEPLPADLGARTDGRARQDEPLRGPGRHPHRRSGPGRTDGGRRAADVPSAARGRRAARAVPHQP